MQKPFLALVLRRRAFVETQITTAVLTVHDLGDVPPEQFLRRIAEHLDQGGVDLEEIAVRREEGHADPAMLEEQTEPIFRIGQALSCLTQ